MQDHHTPTRLERSVHWALLSGLVASAAMLSAGLAIVLVRNEPRLDGPPHAWSLTVRRAIAGDGVALLELGLLVLMATPVLRVAVLVVGWSWEGDRRFALVALAVLGLLAGSLALGFG